MSDRPTVSVIVPVYNGEQFLAEAVASVRAQNYAPLEIIIVDDGSTDGTAEVARGLGDDIQYVYQPNAGPAAARNRGVRLARGELIAFQDADDLWVDDKLAWQLALLAQHPAAQGVLGQSQRVQLDADGMLSPLPGVLGAPRLQPLLHTALFRGKIFNRVGLLDETLRCGEDLDWYLRALEQDIALITHPETVLLYRQHQANLTRNWSIKSQLLRMIKRSLDRRKGRDLHNNSLLTSFVAARRLQDNEPG